MVRIFFKTIRDAKLHQLSDYRLGSWVHVEDPTEAEIDEVCSRLNLDPSIVKDATDPFEVSRIEVEDGKEYIFTRFAVTHEGQITTSPFLIIVNGDYLTTVSKHPLPFLDKFTEGKINFFTTQKTKLFIQLFLAINNDYQKNVTDMRRRIRNIGINVEKIQNQDLVQFVAFESIFNDFLSALEPTNQTLEKLLSGKYLRLFEEDRDLVEDLLLSNKQLIDICRSNIAQIVNIREAYTAIISNNLNKVMKLLTSITVILTIPTMIASFFGMNVPLPLATHPFALGIIITLTITIALFLLYIFNKKDFL